MTQPGITIQGKELIVVPPKYPSQEIKEVLGGKYDKARKHWRLPITAWNVQTLVDWYGKGMVSGRGQLVEDLAFDDWGYAGWDTSDATAILAERAEGHSRWNDLYGFQQEAVEYVTSNPHLGCLLALDPGLGKGPVSIVGMDVLQVSKVLIVAPLTLARNWMAEIDKWSDLYRSWSRATRADKDPLTECVITNHEVIFEPHFYDEDGYDVLVGGGPKRQKEWITKGPKIPDSRTGAMVPARKRVVEVRESYDVDWDLIIVDESVLLKNRKAIKVDMIFQLAKYAKFIWLLSGSPTTRFNNDLFSQMKIIMPRGFKSYWRFTEYFCVVDKGEWGWKVTGDQPDKPPSKYLKDFMFIRSQKDVLPELPDYIYDPIEIDLTAKQLRAFDEMMEDWMTLLDNGKVVSADIALAQMVRAAQITSNLVNIGGERSSAKENLLMDMLYNEEIQFPLLIWTWWVPTAESVFQSLTKEWMYTAGKIVDYVIGAMDAEEKDRVLTDYKTGEVDVLVLQMGVGKFGHTLTDTRTVFYHDRYFDADAYFQSLRRVRRIGLEHKPRLIVPRALHSFDPVVELNLSGKLQSIAKLGNKDLREMLQSLGSSMLPWSMEFEQ